MQNNQESFKFCALLGQSYSGKVIASVYKQLGPEPKVKISKLQMIQIQNYLLILTLMKSLALKFTTPDDLSFQEAFGH